MQRKVTGPGVTDPTCHAERQYRSPPLLYHLGRDIGEYYPIVNTTEEYAAALAEVTAAVAHHNNTMTYRGAPGGGGGGGTSCFLDARTNRTSCFPCASPSCSPKPMCCRTEPLATERGLQWMRSGYATGFGG